MIKDKIGNCLATTGLSLIILAVVANLFHAKFLLIAAVYQTLIANIVIHLGLLLIKRFESRFFLAEMLMEIGYVLAVLIVSGALFGWYSSTPIWVLILMGIAVYFIGGLIGIMQMRQDIAFINSKLKHLSEHEGGSSHKNTKG